jgi:predicted transcriptional regulator
MADYTPVYASGINPFTATTSAAVVGGNVLLVSGAGTVAATAGASAVAIGVAAHDAASGAKVTVWPLNNVVHELPVATGTVTAADGVTSSTSGGVTTAVVGTAAAAGTLIGIALTTAASPNKVRFLGRN